MCLSHYQPATKVWLSAAMSLYCVFIRGSIFCQYWVLLVDRQELQTKCVQSSHLWKRWIQVYLWVVVAEWLRWWIRYPLGVSLRRFESCWQRKMDVWMWWIVHRVLITTTSAFNNVILISLPYSHLCSCHSDIKVFHFGFQLWEFVASLFFGVIVHLNIFGFWTWPWHVLTILIYWHIIW